MPLQFMNKKAVLLFVLFTLPFLAKSQKDSSRLSVGIDLLRSIPSYFNTGYTFEPSLLYATKQGIIIEAAFGVSEIKVNPVYTNVDYFCKGRYAKVGFRVPFKGVTDFSFGLNLGYSTFTEMGKSTFKGKYFGDFTYEQSQQNRLFFLEPGLNYQQKIYGRFSIIMQLRLPIVLSAYNTESFPVYSAPGIGFLRFLATNGDGNTQKSVLGFSVRLVYRLF